MKNQVPRGGVGWPLYEEIMHNFLYNRNKTFRDLFIFQRNFWYGLIVGLDQSFDRYIPFFHQSSVEIGNVSNVRIAKLTR